MIPSEMRPVLDADGKLLGYENVTVIEPRPAWLDHVPPGVDPGIYVQTFVGPVQGPVDAYCTRCGVELHIDEPFAAHLSEEVCSALIATRRELWMKMAEAWLFETHYTLLSRVNHGGPTRRAEANCRLAQENLRSVADVYAATAEQS